MIRRIQRQAEAFAYRLAFLPSHTDSDAPFWLQTTEIPSLNEFDHPAVKEFQEFLDAGLVPPDPKEAVAEYLNHLRPDNRIHYNLLRRYVGEPELDSYPYTMTRPPAPTLPHEPYAEVTYPQGYELDYDDPEPGAHYAGSRHPFDRALAAARFTLAMADTTMWHPRIEQDHRDGHAGWHEGTYRIKGDDGKTIGAMQYSMVPEIEHRPVDRRPPKSIIIDKVFVHPQHRGKGIAQSFVERLHNDFPDYKIDPGATTTHGNGFAEHLRKILPDAEHALIPDYTPNVMDDRASDFYDRTQRGYYRAYSGDEDNEEMEELEANTAPEDDIEDDYDAPAREITPPETEDQLLQRLRNQWPDGVIQHAASVLRYAAALVVDPPTLECNHRTPCAPGTCPQRDIAADPDFYAEFPDPADKEREFQDLYRLQYEDDAADARATNRPSAVEKAEILPPAQPARDILTEFVKERGRRNRRPIVITCPDCKGHRYETIQPGQLRADDCRTCKGEGSFVKPSVEEKLRPWAERLENALYNEFMEWWPQSEASRIRKPEGSGTKWEDRPKEPVTHWLNVEDFLKERYPDAATGANYGGEEAQNLLERAIQERPDPKWLEERGYVGYGNPVTQAMLTLHNRFNLRPWRNKEDRRRYYELMLRHVGPGAAQRQKVAASSEHYEPMDDDFLDGLRKQFDEWAATSPDVVNPDPDGQPRGPVGHWPNIEKFFQEKYPAAYKGLSRGLESAVPALDSDAGDYCPHCTGEGYLLNENPHPADLPRKCLSCSGTGKINDDLVYETGPDAEAKYGYDPKAVAAGLLYLHSESHPYRFHMRQEDHNRLTDIFQKRMKMQRQYEQRTAAPNRTEPLSSSPDTDSIIYGLSSEFDEWAKANNKGNPYDHRVLTTPRDLVPKNWKPRGPVGYWPNIEEFMKERYPAAHRGLSMGFEDADPLLDSGGKHEDGTDLEWLVGKDPYETGPEAVAKHGYDPREIAATLLLLHNDTHPGRENYLKSDQARLLDIAQKRHQMQQAYEEKQKVAAFPYTPVRGRQNFSHPLVDTIGKEFDDWATANGAENPNDHPDSLGYWGKPRGAIGYWPNVEEFLEENYPEAHRGLEMGLEGAGSLRDYGAPSGMVLAPDDYEPPEDLMDYAPYPPEYAEYETGAWAEAQHGYDPKEVVTALLLLHNQTHPHRWEQVNADQDVLMDIAQKRHKMQKAYDERMKTAAQRTWHQHLASINRLGAELSDADAAMLYDHMQKLFQPIKPSGKWYHVSPHALADGTDLIPGGGDSPSQSFYDDGWGEDTGTLTDMGQGRTGHVWLTPDLDDAHFWSAALSAPHIYEVDPHEDPRPWNGTGADGWVVPGAKIRRKVIE